MSILDKVFNLPKISSGNITKIASDQSNPTINISSASKLITEGYKKINSTFKTNPFDKIAAASPGFKLLATAGILTAQKTLFSKPENQAMVSGEVSKLKSSTTSTSASEVNASLTVSEVIDDSHKIILEVPKEYLSNTSPLVSERIVFDNMPNIQEQRQAEYSAVSVPQMPGDFQKYTGTKSTSWNITAKLTASTKSEAQKNYYTLNALRGWTMPYFGEKQRTGFTDKLGSPPPIIKLYGWRGIIGPVSVVLTSVNWTWDDSVSWISTGIPVDGHEVPFPTVVSVTINLTETFTPEQFNNFDLEAFKNGDMATAWGQVKPTIIVTNIPSQNNTPNGGGSSNEYVTSSNYNPNEAKYNDYDFGA